MTTSMQQFYSFTLFATLAAASFDCSRAVSPCDGGMVFVGTRCVPEVDVPGAVFDIPTPPSSDVIVVPPNDDVPSPLLSSTSKLDMLFVIDNSGSMRDNQRALMDTFSAMLTALGNPLCRSRANPQTPAHSCVAGNPDDVRIAQPLTDLRVGVITSDLGTPGSVIPGCDDSERGDDGRLNPIRSGPAVQSHLPWAPRRPNAETAPPGFRPIACNNTVDQFPPFVTYCSNTADRSCDRDGINTSTRDPNVFADWFRCNAGLFVNGCGLESPLEATWRALVEHGAATAPGGAAPNAGFIRDDAVLAIVMLTDEEDGSVRNCAHDLGFSAQSGAACVDARDVYNLASMAWAHPTNPDTRFYLYTPGDSRDPTWNLNRYYNTAPRVAANRWNRDWLSLKPGRPDRLIFAAITGVPLAVPVTPNPVMGEPALVAWEQLLGQPSMDPNDFFGRNSASAIAGMQGIAGPFSMRQANQDPNCTQMVPACRREGTTYDPMRSCSNAQYMAFASRRIVETARRFDEFPACNGQPCRNGIVASICAANLSGAIPAIVTKIHQRFGM